MAEYAVPTLPLGSDVVVTVSPVAIAIDSGCGGETAPALSFVVTLKLNGLPVALVGVPPIAPLDAFSVKPGGSAPALRAQLP